MIRFQNVSLMRGTKPLLEDADLTLNPGDKILGLSLQEGGHLTHGLAVNFSGRLFEAHFYGLDPATGLIDYDALQAKAKEIRPKAIIAGHMNQ